MHAIFLLIFVSPLLLGFWYLPRLVRSFGWLITLCLGSWVGAGLIVAYFFQSLSSELANDAEESLQQLADIQLVLTMSAIGIPLYGFTIGAIPRGIDLLFRCGATTSKRAWQISLAVLFTLPALPLLIYGY